MKKDKNYQVSSGNLFADLGIINPEERFAKAELAYQINTLIRKKNFTQEEAAELLGIDQSKVLTLSKGKLSGFSLERLFRLLNILGQDIVIKVIPKIRSSKKADLSVNVSRFKKKIPVRR